MTKTSTRIQIVKSQQSVIRRLESEITIVQGLYKRYVRLIADHESDLNRQYSLDRYRSYDMDALRKIGSTLLMLLRNYTKLLQDYIKECLKSQQNDSYTFPWWNCRRDKDRNGYGDSDRGSSSHSIPNGDTVY